jgi:hypothetical protein
VLWGTAVLLCLGIKSLTAGPAVVQLLLGSAVFMCFLVVHVRGPILCASDREILLRLFPGKEMRFLRVLGLLSPAVPASGLR